MKNPSKQEISHEKNKKIAPVSSITNAIFTTFRKLNALPRFQIISFLRQDEGGVKIGLSPTLAHRRIFGAEKQPNGG